MLKRILKSPVLIRRYASSINKTQSIKTLSPTINVDVENGGKLEYLKSSAQQELHDALALKNKLLMNDSITKGYLDILKKKSSDVKKLIIIP